MLYLNMPNIPELVLSLNNTTFLCHSCRSRISDVMPNAGVPINGCWLVVDGLGRVWSFSI